jgi:endonuclease-3
MRLKQEIPNVTGVVRALRKHYASARCALEYETPEQLLVATILSAQCTDQRVNIVTRELFGKYPTPQHLAQVPLGELEKAIASTGFFRNKAKSIQQSCQILVDRYGGQVPADFESLVQLPGVGRKTANVVLGTAFGIASGVVVDTHVARVSRRLGFTRHQDPAKIEQDLMRLLPKREWIMFSHRIIHHGRRICKARRPMCDCCCLLSMCPRIGVAK